jgi:hypothetical protein
MKERLTLQMFVGRACQRQYGCTLKITEVPVEGPRGFEEWKYLKRGKDLIGVLPHIPDEEYLTSSQLRSLVAQLNLPALDFGFEFG